MITQGLGQRTEVSNLRDRGCDTELPDQGCRTYQGRVISLEIVKWWLAGKTKKKKLRENLLQYHLFRESHMITQEWTRGSVVRSLRLTAWARVRHYCFTRLRKMLSVAKERRFRTHNENLRNLYCLLSSVAAYKSVRMRWTGWDGWEMYTKTSGLRTSRTEQVSAFQQTGDTMSVYAIFSWPSRALKRCVLHSFEQNGTGSVLYAHGLFLSQCLEALEVH